MTKHDPQYNDPYSIYDYQYDIYDYNYEFDALTEEDKNLKINQSEKS